MNSTIKPGDIYSSNLPDGRYGAVKIIDIIEKSFLIATSAYIGETIPNIENDKINKILIQNRFMFKNEPAIRWLEGKKPKEMLYIGNIPVTDVELNMMRNSYGGKWSISCGIEVYMEWRWLNDRENFENEVKERQTNPIVKKTSQKPKKMMADEAFWNIVSLLDWKYEGQDEKVLETAIKELSKRSNNDIKEFAEALAFKLYQLDTKEHAQNIGEYSFKNDEEFFSSDGFLYVRCVAIANGERFYNLVLNNPVHMPKDKEFESLLYLAPEAYNLKNNRDFEYSTGCDYETFSNRNGWL
jgi:hypothetical protein